MLVPKSFRLLALLGAGCLPYACSSGSSSTSDAGPPTDATADAYGAEGGGSGEASADASVDASPDALAAEGGADVSPGDAGIETGAEAGAPQHLYVGNDNALGGIRRYTLPVTPSSMPEFVIADANITTLALDGSGDLAAGDNAGNLTFFTAPLSGASTPGATFNNRMFDGGDAGAGKNDGQIAFLPGDTTLFAANLGKSVNVFDSPFSNATMPASSITSAGLTGAFGLAFDAAKNLYVSNPGAPGSTLYVFPPPYTGTPLVTPLLTGRAYRKLVVSATQLFVCDVGGTNGGVDVYDLPLTTSSAPAFSMTQGMQAPEGIAMDSRGNLYVGNLSNATVNVYAPPFSASSAPASGIALAPDGGAYAVFGIAIGL